MLALICGACGLHMTPGARDALTRSSHRPAISMQLWAGKKRARYEDDGSRLNGADLVDDDALSKGWFSNFKWGTEVEVVGSDNVGKKVKPKKTMKGMAKDNSDRGLGECACASGTCTQTQRKGQRRGQRQTDTRAHAHTHTHTHTHTTEPRKHLP